MNKADINTISEFEDFIAKNTGAAIYFSTPTCNVCKVLKPKLIELLDSEFPQMNFAYVNCEIAKELSAQNSIFAVPTVLFYFEGKEFIRTSRNINLEELYHQLNRPYSFIF